MYDGTQKTRGRFDNGVPREFMDHVLALCEGWADWNAVGGWEAIKKRKNIKIYIYKIFIDKNFFFATDSV